ncbi:MAG: signal peptide peptidase SppA [Candidatus Firestonebacteria bacterium]
MENSKLAVLRFIVILICAIVILNILRLMFASSFTLGERVNILPGKRIGVIYITGPIYNSKPIVNNLKRFKKDGTIKSIILRIDSPGGAVAPTQEIVEEIKNVRSEGKKVIVSCGSVVASGGYYIACVADRIFANPGTLAGSIGVIMEFVNLEGLLNKIGIKLEVVKSGKYKDIGSSSRKLTSEEQKLLQEVIDDVYHQFVDAIVDGRKDILRSKLIKEKGIKKPTREDMKNEILKIADGRIFSGKQAKELGLVDELGTMDDAKSYAAMISGIKGEPEIVEERKKISFLEYLIGDNDNNLDNILSKFFHNGFSYLYGE